MKTAQECFGVRQCQAQWLDHRAGALIATGGDLAGVDGAIASRQFDHHPPPHRVLSGLPASGQALPPPGFGRFLAQSHGEARGHQRHLRRPENRERRWPHGDNDVTGRFVVGRLFPASLICGQQVSVSTSGQLSYEKSASMGASFPRASLFNASFLLRSSGPSWLLRV